MRIYIETFSPYVCSFPYVRHMSICLLHTCTEHILIPALRDSLGRRAGWWAHQPACVEEICISLVCEIFNRDIKYRDI